MPEKRKLLAAIRQRWPRVSTVGATLTSEGAANHVASTGQWVFRFPRNRVAREGLELEERLLKILPRYVDLPVPESQMLRGVMRQRKLSGQPLDRHTLLRQPRHVQDRLVRDLARFLFQLHRVRRDELRAAGVGETKVTVGRADAVKLYREVEKEVMPHLQSFARQVIREHFAPVLDGRLSLEYEPVLIHGDLNPSHIFWDPRKRRLCGVIDFGMAGTGDSALDYAFMILTLGETPLRRMYAHHRGIRQKIDRARFWALAIELQYCLTALRTRKPRWLVGHIGSARDHWPIGS